eukprot:TRINITY_DN2187_c0_g1_i1.p1 TRINITY_DN2187_c0_g1~~TRINITY_DN2187_c0_g1_i1.p1  ORF type:complete len:1814 (+),score=196.59 TRINITY_DN2187_c0_g1_i1:45-5444(+)
MAAPSWEGGTSRWGAALGAADSSRTSASVRGHCGEVRSFLAALPPPDVSIDGWCSDDACQPRCDPPVPLPKKSQRAEGKRRAGYAAMHARRKSHQTQEGTGCASDPDDLLSVSGAPEPQEPTTLPVPLSPPRNPSSGGNADLQTVDGTQVLPPQIFKYTTHLAIPESVSGLPFQGRPDLENRLPQPAQKTGKRVRRNPPPKQQPPRLAVEQEEPQQPAPVVPERSPSVSSPSPARQASPDYRRELREALSGPWTLLRQLEAARTARRRLQTGWKTAERRNLEQFKAVRVHVLTSRFGDAHLAAAARQRRPQWRGGGTVDLAREERLTRSTRRHPAPQRGSLSSRADTYAEMHAKLLAKLFVVALHSYTAAIRGARRSAEVCGRLGTLSKAFRTLRSGTQGVRRLRSFVAGRHFREQAYLFLMWRRRTAAAAGRRLHALHADHFWCASVGRKALRALKMGALLSRSERSAAAAARLHRTAEAWSQWRSALHRRRRRPAPPDGTFGARVLRRRAARQALTTAGTALRAAQQVSSAGPHSRLAHVALGAVGAFSCQALPPALRRMRGVAAAAGTERRGAAAAADARRQGASWPAAGGLGGETAAATSHTPPARRGYPPFKFGNESTVVILGSIEDQIAAGRRPGGTPGHSLERESPGVRRPVSESRLSGRASLSPAQPSSEPGPELSSVSAGDSPGASTREAKSPPSPAHRVAELLVRSAVRQPRPALAPTARPADQSAPVRTRAARPQPDPTPVLAQPSVKTPAPDVCPTGQLDMAAAVARMKTVLARHSHLHQREAAPTDRRAPAPKMPPSARPVSPEPVGVYRSTELRDALAAAADAVGAVAARAARDQEDDEAAQKPCRCCCCRCGPVSSASMSMSPPSAPGGQLARDAPAAPCSVGGGGGARDDAHDSASSGAQLDETEQSARLSRARPPSRTASRDEASLRAADDSKMSDSARAAAARMSLPRASWATFGDAPAAEDHTDSRLSDSVRAAAARMSLPRASWATFGETPAARSNTEDHAEDRESRVGTPGPCESSGSHECAREREQLSHASLEADCSGVPEAADVSTGIAASGGPAGRVGRAQDSHQATGGTSAGCTQTAEHPGRRTSLASGLRSERGGDGKLRGERRRSQGSNGGTRTRSGSSDRRAPARPCGPRSLGNFERPHRQPTRKLSSAGAGRSRRSTSSDRRDSTHRHPPRRSLGECRDDRWPSRRLSGSREGARSRSSSIGPRPRRDDGGDGSRHRRPSARKPSTASGVRRCSGGSERRGSTRPVDSCSRPSLGDGGAVHSHRPSRRPSSASTTSAHARQLEAADSMLGRRLLRTSLDLWAAAWRRNAERRRRVLRFSARRYVRLCRQILRRWRGLLFARDEQQPAAAVRPQCIPPSEAHRLSQELLRVRLNGCWRLWKEAAHAGALVRAFRCLSLLRATMRAWRRVSRRRPGRAELPPRPQRSLNSPSPIGVLCQVSADCESGTSVSPRGHSVASSRRRRPESSSAATRPRGDHRRTRQRSADSLCSPSDASRATRTRKRTSSRGAQTSSPNLPSSVRAGAETAPTSSSSAPERGCETTAVDELPPSSAALEAPPQGRGTTRRQSGRGRQGGFRALGPAAPQRTLQMRPISVPISSIERMSPSLGLPGEHVSEARAPVDAGPPPPPPPPPPAVPQTGLPAPSWVLPGASAVNRLSQTDMWSVPATAQVHIGRVSPFRQQRSPVLRLDPEPRRSPSPAPSIPPTEARLAESMRRAADDIASVLQRQRQSKVVAASRADDVFALLNDGAGHALWKEVVSLPPSAETRLPF